MRELGIEYGDMVAHNLLWLGCFESRLDGIDRMSIVPMSQEARGLDAGPRLYEKLKGRGDMRTAKIVNRIAKEELNHVAVGVYWFRQMCGERENIFDDDTLGRRYNDSVRRLAPDILRGPFAHKARELCGLHSEWYDGTLKERLITILAMEEANVS